MNTPFPTDKPVEGADAIDAAMLARMAERLAPDPVAPPTPEQEALKELASARQAAIDAYLRRELATRLRAVPRHVERLA